MNATCDRQTTPTPARSACERELPSKPPRTHRAGGAALIILAGYLLFAHGCHGDEDNELFTSFARALTRLCQQ